MVAVVGLNGTMRFDSLRPVLRARRSISRCSLSLTFCSSMRFLASAMNFRRRHALYEIRWKSFKLCRVYGAVVIENKILEGNGFVRHGRSVSAQEVFLRRPLCAFG